MRIIVELTVHVQKVQFSVSTSCADKVGGLFEQPLTDEFIKTAQI